MILISEFWPCLYSKLEIDKSDWSLCNQAVQNSEMDIVSRVSLLTVRMWYVGGSRPDGAQVGRFSFWGAPVPKGFLAANAYFGAPVITEIINMNQSAIMLSLQEAGYLGELKHFHNSVTVVIFSSPVNVDTSKYPKLSIQNIELSPVKPQSDDVRIANKIVDTIYNLYSSQTKSLKIICIDAVGAKGAFSVKEANESLKYLIKDINPVISVDVIILPNFFVDTGQDAHEIMESLWYLREHTVLITNSSLHATLPSTEVIAVGGATAKQKAQASVLDFVVARKKGKSKGKESLLTEDDSDWLDGDQVQSLAPAVVAAIVLNILDCYPKMKELVTGDACSKLF